MVELRDLPELHVIGLTNVNASGEPYPKNHIHDEWLPHSEYNFNPDGVFFIQYTENSGPDDERFEAHLFVPIAKKKDFPKAR